MSRGGAAVLLAVVAALAIAPSAGATGPDLSAAGGARFPERTFVLTLPERAQLGPGAVRVTENGGPVRGLSVEPLGFARRSRLGVVLVIDTSASMRGAPLDGALAAARAFARERNPRQPLALVTFNGRTRVAMPLTTDPYEIRSALSRKGAAGGGTHIYDAGSAAVRLVRRARLPGGFVVLLSDGSDRGSATTARALAVASRAAHVRIYTVGLRSRAFESKALGSLAAAAGGEYSEASSSGQLARIYSALGSGLSNGYLVRYRSLAGPRDRVRVAAQVSGFGAAGASYTTPALAAPKQDPVARRGPWSSPLALAAVVLLCAALIGLALAVVASRARQTPRQRVAQFVAPAGDPEQRPLASRIVAGTERSLASSGWWAAFEEQVDVAGMGWPPAKLVVAWVSGAIALAVLLLAATGSALLGLAALVLLPPAGRAVVRGRAERERHRFGEQLSDNLAVVAGAMRAGHGLAGALASVVGDAPEPSRRELERVVADERLGAPLEEALDRAAQRMRNRELEQVAMLAVLQREAGADTAEMLDRVVATIRERHELRRAVRTLTAQGRLSRWILTALPAVVLAFLTAVNPTYVDPLYHTATGRLLLALAAAMVLTGSLVIKRIINFEI
jgi:tight adherence protein B